MKRRDFIRSGLIAGLVAPLLKRTGPAVKLPAAAPPELERPAASPVPFSAVSWDGKFFLYASGEGKMLESGDGITWTERGIHASKFQNR